MAEGSLQDRLRDHAKAFDGLLSLIPAKMYYGEDTSDQWKKKKQTKAEAKAAKRNKLDPDSELNRNAKEVMDERARTKRKLQDMQDDDDNSDSQEDVDEVDDDLDLDLDVEKEKPGEGLRKKTGDVEAEEKASKKVKLADTTGDDEELSKKEKERAEKKLAKKQKKEEKKQAKKVSTEEEAPEVEDTEPCKKQAKEPKATKKCKDAVQHPSTEEADADAVGSDVEMEDISVPGLADDEDEDASASAAASTPHSPLFDTSKPSAEAEVSTTASSLNSAVAPSEKPKHIQIPTDTTALRARLAARIEALRAARKADKEDGTPVRTRQELLDFRRETQARRKAHKKEQRLKAKAEEDAKREEALASARSSPHLLDSPLVGLDNVDTNFAFGRVAFQDGTTLSRDLTYEKEGGAHKKRQMDPKSALAKIEAQKTRLSQLDPEKQKEVLEKETWLAARKRAEGEKVRDDEGLLKKAVKRKDKAKKKSEKEWNERKAGVTKGIRERDLKRDANLKARAAGKGQKGKKKSGPTKKKAARPGFEGAGFGKK